MKSATFDKPVTHTIESALLSLPQARIIDLMQAHTNAGLARLYPSGRIAK